jgi:hypothetical protein
MNTTLLKLQILNNFLSESQKYRQILLNELIDNATDPVVKKRRFRMLSNLSTFEADMIKKINEFETDNVHDLLQYLHILNAELEVLLDRSA